MTCVSGHLTELTFGPDYNDWSYPPPERLFDAPVRTTIDQVCGSDQTLTWNEFAPNKVFRKTELSPRILKTRQEVPGLSSSGLIAIWKESILVARCGQKL